VVIAITALILLISKSSYLHSLHIFIRICAKRYKGDQVMKKVSITLCSTLVVILLALWGISNLLGYTFYYVDSDDRISTDLKRKGFKKGDIVSPLYGLDFDQGEWIVYILLIHDDYKLLKHKVPKNCLKLTDRETMKQMQQQWNMVYTGGDAVTVTSRIVFIRDGNIVFSSAIDLTSEKNGLQSRYFGWIEPQSQDVMWEYCNKFEPVFWPVLIL
jgi:hypothetical protein